MLPVLAIVVAYIVGSVPFAFLLARRRGIDLRQVGSGNVGASNVLRTSGAPRAVLAMCLDAAKGSVAVVIANGMTSGTATPVAAGLASVIGHIYPVWLGFRGGKGVATAAGVFAVLTPIAVAIAGAVFVVSVWISRYISVGSMAAAIALALTAVVSHAPQPVVAGAILAALIIMHRHRGNLARVMAGTEHRVGQRLF
jgi:glycerol-3-phosphate acyltransferase PlsY